MHWYDMLVAFSGPLLGMLGGAIHHSIVTSKSPIVQSLAPLAIQTAEPALLKEANKLSPALGAVASDVLGGAIGETPTAPAAPVATPVIADPAVITPPAPAFPAPNNEGR